MPSERKSKLIKNTKRNHSGLCNFACNSHHACNGHIGGLLSKYEINKYGLIDPHELNQSCLKGTSYDLRLGDRHYVYKMDKKKWIPVFIGDERSFVEANKVWPPFERTPSLKIDSFGSALIQLKETIDTLSCIENNGVVITGRFDLKLKIVAKGLFSQQATQVEPYSRGKLYCYLFNLTPNIVELSYEERISTIGNRSRG